MDKFALNEINGDLFSADDSYCLAHCVAEDMRLGKGIAMKFKDKFGRLTELKSQNITTGHVAVLAHKQRFIYYLVTKKSSWGKPTYQQLESSLLDMKAHMELNGMSKLAMPRIGCGLDGLSWPKVKEMLENVFKCSQIEIVIYNFVPAAKNYK